MLTFIPYKFSRAGRVEQNFRGLLWSLLETHLDGTLALAVAVDGKLDMIPVLVPKSLPKERDAFALIEQKRSRLVGILSIQTILRTMSKSQIKLPNGPAESSQEHLLDDRVFSLHGECRAVPSSRMCWLSAVSRRSLSVVLTLHEGKAKMEV